MNIGIDIDDTISNTYETFLPYFKKYVEEKLNKKIDLNISSNIDYFNIVERYKFSEKEARNFWVNYYVLMLESVIPKKDCVKIINKLKEEGNKIFLVTARIDDEIVDVKTLTKNWLNANNIMYDKLIVNCHNKLEIAKKEKIDVFIDDSIRNCEILSNGGINTYMYETKNNMFYSNEKIIKVSSWNEFYQNLKEVV